MGQEQGGAAEVAQCALTGGAALQQSKGDWGKVSFHL